MKWDRNMIGMKRDIGIAQALLALRPGDGFAIRDDNYDGIEWYGVSSTIPTAEEIDSKIEELRAQEPMRMLREIRDWYLQNTDWTQGADIQAIRSQEWRDAWSNYRQQLRALTETQTPYFQNPTDLHISGVTWPTPPSES